MVRKRPESTSRKWIAGLSMPEASRSPSFGLLVPRQMIALTPILGHLENVD